MIDKNSSANYNNIIYDCLIAGAGAAGLFCAASMHGKGKKLILEKTARPGQKLLLSGNGMCNITHGGSIKDFPAHYSSSGSSGSSDSSVSSGKPGVSGSSAEAGGKIRSCLYRHSNLELIKMCEDSGVPLTERDDGKVFPASLKAGDILDMLLAKARSNGFELRCSSEITAIDPGASKSAGSAELPGSIAVYVKGTDEPLRTRRLIIATGGASYPATGSDGTFMNILKRDLDIQTEDLKPALVPVYVENYPYADLSGISFGDVEVSCAGMTRRGPMLLTHRGFSGPVMLHLSQYVDPGQILRINYLPEMKVHEVFRKLKADQPGEQRGISNYLAKEFGLPKAFAEKMFADPARKFSSIGPKELENVAHLMTDRVHKASGTGGWNEAMVTAGGVALCEIDLKTMSLIKYPDIKVIGEALDINGDTGGYNLQFAYSTAVTAL